MKKIYFILVAVLISLSAMAEKSMVVELKSGDKVIYPVEEVNRVLVGPPAYSSVSGLFEGYEYVDLGLESGTLWATCNVGASSPVEVGDYFAWAEIRPKQVYADSTYVGTSDFEWEILRLSEDAATQNVGPKWMTPGGGAFLELVKSCTWKRTDNYMSSGVAGRVGTSKINGETIFFPNTGYMDGSEVMSGTWPFYMNSGCNAANEEVYVSQLSDVYSVEMDHSYGFAVRPVINPLFNFKVKPVDAQLPNPYFTSERNRVVICDVLANHLDMAIDAKPVDKINNDLWLYSRNDTSFYLNMKNGKIVLDTSLAYVFQKNEYMEEVIFTEAVDMGKVRNMRNMFGGCRNLKNVDFAGMDLSNVADMSEMFVSCSNLQRVNFSGARTSSKLTTISEMFGLCSGLESLDLSGLNTEGVVYMDYLFYSCSNLKTVDISSFNTANVKKMYAMFDCENLVTVYASKDFVTTGVTNKEEIVIRNGYKLVGGKGTTWDKSRTGLEFAHVDGGAENPGLFTEK